jgi:hypothetical protein
MHNCNLFNVGAAFILNAYKNDKTNVKLLTKAKLIPKVLTHPIEGKYRKN